MAAHRSRHSRESDLHSLIDSIYSTIEAPEAWREVVPKVALSLGAESALLFTPMDAHLPRGFGITHNIPDESLRSYGAYFHSRDVWKEAADRHGLLKAGSLFRGEEILPLKAVLRSEIYGDLWRPIGIAHLLCADLTDEQRFDPGPSTLFSFFRGIGASAFSDVQARHCHALVPHMRRALLTARRLEVVEGLLAAYQAGLDAAGEVVLVLAVDMSVHHASGEPAGLFGPGSILRIAGRKLTANEPAVRSRLELAVHNAAAGRAADPVRAQGLDGIEAEITVVRLPDARLVASIRPIRRSPAMAVARVGERYRLTEAERRVLVLLARGASVAEVAAILAIRPMTVRTHLSNMFDKTGARSQRGLVALVWQSA
ncbi:MAG: helix-turn-helix transcriptional regulator [Betaproteobacteria bacterium]